MKKIIIFTLVFMLMAANASALITELVDAPGEITGGDTMKFSIKITNDERSVVQLTGFRMIFNDYGCGAFSVNSYFNGQQINCMPDANCSIYACEGNFLLNRGVSYSWDTLIQTSIAMDPGYFNYSFVVDYGYDDYSGHSWTSGYVGGFWPKPVINETANETEEHNPPPVSVDIIEETPVIDDTPSNETAPIAENDTVIDDLPPIEEQPVDFSFWTYLLLLLSLISVICVILFFWKRNKKEADNDG